MSKTGNPSAFPVHMNCPRHGMTLRDYFAAKAMQSFLLSDRYQGVVGINCYEHNRAADAYIIADAMLAERAK